MQVDVEKVLRKSLSEWLDGIFGRDSVAPPVRRLVEFRSLNLAGETWPVEGFFDVIFCRNVLMYLEDRLRYAVVERMTSLLAQDGVLMLDPAEHLGKAENWFTPLADGGYSRRGEACRKSGLTRVSGIPGS